MSNEFGYPRFRKKTATEWATQNPVLREGEPGYEKGTALVKVGNGVDHWNDLPYWPDISSMPIPDQVDYSGDIADLQTSVAEAQTTADGAQTAAAEAQTSAGTAQTAADQAQSTANGAQTVATGAQSAVAAANTTQDVFTKSQVSLARLEREFLTRQDANQREIARRVTDAAAAFIETWGTPVTAAAVPNWTSGTATVASNRMFNSAGIARAVPTSPRWVMRGTLHTTGVSGKSAYMGVQLVDGSVLGLGQTSSSATMFVNRTGSFTAGNTVIPRTLPALPAGDYLVTITKDETCLSITMQAAGNSGQAVYGVRYPLTGLASALSTVWISATDTVATGMTWGNVVVYNELEVPPAASRAGLFTNTQPLVIWRQDTNGNGWYLSIPGDNDPRVPVPLVEFCHQSLATSGGGGTAPWTETRWANVLSALNAAGYILVSSDNGPGITSGGTQDKYGNQAGLDDYIALIKWCRQRFSTSHTFLIGASMGAYFVFNLLQRREIGGLAAAASISGGFDLLLGLSNPTYRTPVLNAYGAVDDADYTTKTLAYDPRRQPGYKFRGVPVRIYSGTADTLAPPADAVDPIVNSLGPYAPEVSVVSVAGATHLADTLYQGSDLVSFFEKYR